MLYFFMRMSFIVLMGLLGYQLAQKYGGSEPLLVGIGLGLGIGFVIAETVFKKVSLRGLSSSIFGALLGIVMSKLVFEVMRLLKIEPVFVQYAYPFLTFIFLYLGIMYSFKRRDEFALIIPYVRFKRTDMSLSPIIVDTSALIDGRLNDILSSGFIEGRIIVPRFILNEVQQLADSSDPTTRDKGRAALQALEDIKKNPKIDLAIYEETLSDVEKVDDKIIRFAKMLEAKVLTLDYNLNRITSLEGITVLNINDLANALKPQYRASQKLTIKILKPGKEYNQGVGYTDEGVMVVVENGRQLIGKVVDVEITSVLQTSAGRMLFAKIVQNGRNREG